jgi:CRISPR-associated endonuclease/helicase Cas3
MQMDTTTEKTAYWAHVSADGTRSQSVRQHLLGTAALAEQFARPFHAESQAHLAGLLHDIGKYSCDFQRRLTGSADRVDHSTAGAKEAWQLRQAEVAFAVAGHHSGLPDGGGRTDSSDTGTLFGRIYREVPDYSAWHDEINLPEASHPAQIPRDNFSASFYIRMLYSCLVDADYLDTESFMLESPTPRGGYTSLPHLLYKLEQYVEPWWSAKTVLNQKRCDILRACLDAGRTCDSGLYTLTVPTGGGKTVSSLGFALTHAAAQKKKRIIYVIPYTSIIDQTAAVFQEILGTENVLEHHSGIDFFVPENDVDPMHYRKVLATENWDAPVIVTTAVQFFESLYSNRSSRCRKLHNITDSVVIFDEAQTLPVNYLRPCVAAIGQLVQYYSVTAVLCTATQPALRPLFDELAPKLSLHEICPDTNAMYLFFRRNTLHIADMLTEEDLAEQLNAIPQALCVVNRRTTAQKMYTMLEADGRYCLTTLLCPADRKRLLKEIRARLKNGLPCRVVSTSLIEAGVDVDFPAAWREEAGLDSVLQTAGRCNREGRYSAENSIVTVFRLQDQRIPAIIRPNVDATRKIMDTFPDPAQPDAIETYFSYFHTLKGNAALDKNQIMDMFCKGYQGRIFPFASAAEQFHLIEANTVTIYLPVDHGINLLNDLRAGWVSRTLYRQLGQYAVNIYPEHLQKLLDAGAAEPIDDNSYILTDPALYDRSTGLSLDVETGKGIFM